MNIMMVISSLLLPAPPLKKNCFPPSFIRLSLSLSSPPPPPPPHTQTRACVDAFSGAGNQYLRSGGNNNGSGGPSFTSITIISHHNLHPDIAPLAPLACTSVLCPDLRRSQKTHKLRTGDSSGLSSARETRTASLLRTD